MESAPDLRAEMRAFVTPSMLEGLQPVVTDFLLYFAVLAGAMIVHLWWARLLFGVLAGNLIAGLFVLGHDAAHNSLTPSPRLNKVLAYLCMLPALHNYTLWRFEHNRNHHQLPNVQHMDSWSPFSYDEFRALPAWRRALERFYRSGLGFGLYYLVHRWWAAKFYPHGPFMQQMKPRVRMAAFADFALLLLWLGLFGASLMAVARAYGDPSPWLALLYGWVVPFAVWNFMVGYTVYYQHTHPQIPWFRSREAMEANGGQEQVTVAMKYSRVYGFLTHQIMEHHAHHVHPLIPHYRLRAAQARLAELVRTPLIVERPTLPHLLQVHRTCKLYDYDRHRWLDFAGRPTSEVLVAASPLGLAA